MSVVTIMELFDVAKVKSFGRLVGIGRERESKAVRVHKQPVIRPPSVSSLVTVGLIVPLAS